MALLGKAGRRLPKSHCGIETELEIAGIALGHSMLTGGPIHHPAIHPGLYRYLSLDAMVEISFDDLPMIEDIPLNAQTGDLIMMIEEVSL